MKPSGLKGKKIAVTGHTGFLGGHVVAALKRAGAEVAGASRRTGVNLLVPDDAKRFVALERPDVLVHLAATVGGIGANMAMPGTFFSDNMKMGMNVVEACRHAKIPLVVIGTVCSYGKNCSVPFREDDFWTEYPEKTNAPYGIAKKAIQVMCSAYRSEFALRYLFLVPTNLVGEGDNFDEHSSHVIPALIRRFTEAKKAGTGTVRCWGTGAATRSFLYAGDAADAIAKGTASVMGGLDFDGIVNLSGCLETSMRRVSEIIASEAGYKGIIGWDHTKPDGQPRRAVSGDRAREILGWSPSTTLEEAIKRTVAWYLKNRMH